MSLRTKFNAKRRLAEPPPGPEDVARLLGLSNVVIYEGNAAHKRNPGNFQLAPPFGPRTDKTLCDDAGIVSKAVAEDLLRAGLRRGIVSDQYRGQWPQNVWSVTESGIVLEGVLGNQDRGDYHGYPVPPSDPFREEVLARWNGQ